MSELGRERVAARGDARSQATPDPSPILPAPGIDAVARRALLSAASDVGAEWTSAGHAASSPGEVGLAIGAIVESVAAIVAGAPPNLDRITPLVPARRVLERLRERFVRATTAGDLADRPAAALAVVRAMEALLVAMDADAGHRLASRLAGADAQQLVVEMAHDMRSPLGSILILAERLRAGAGGEMAPLQQRQLGLIYSAAFGLSALAGDVIELARGGTTLIDLQPLPFAVSDVLQSIGDILRPMAEEKRLEMSWDVPAADLRMGHPAALNRVLLNLATNAIKFTNAGSVRIACRELDRVRVEFSVSDTGRGIPPYVLANLFEAFRPRQAPGDYAFSSAGLGLSICQKLVGAMGGELGVATELERGTRFHFTLSLPQPERL